MIGFVASPGIAVGPTCAMHFAGTHGPQSGVERSLIGGFILEGRGIVSTGAHRIIGEEGDDRCEIGAPVSAAILARWIVTGD